MYSIYNHLKIVDNDGRGLSKTFYCNTRRENMTHFAIGNTNAIANVTIIKSYTFILVGEPKQNDVGVREKEPMNAIVKFKKTVIIVSCLGKPSWTS